MFETLKGYDIGAFLRVFTDQEAKFETPGRHDISLTMNLITGVTKGNGKKEKRQIERNLPFNNNKLDHYCPLLIWNIRNLISYLTAHVFCIFKRSIKQTANCTFKQFQ